MQLTQSTLRSSVYSAHYSAADKVTFYPVRLV